MSARRFRADIGSTAAKVERREIAGVTSIGKGDSDGEVVITYSHADLPQPVRIQALAQETSEYPDGNNFMLFIDDDDAPPEVMKAMELAQEYLLGVTVTEMVSEVAKHLTQLLAQKTTTSTTTYDDSDEPMTDYDDDIVPGDGDSDSDDASDFLGHDDEYFGLGSPKDEHSQGMPTNTNTSSFSLDSDNPVRQRIKSDLRAAKKAGFRVGVLNGLGITDTAGLVSVSIRVSKFDISDEALIAWDVPEDDYVVLLIKFDSRYYPLEKIVDLPPTHSGIQFRIGLCKSYKPSVFDALKAFSNLPPGAESPREHGVQATFRPMFISASLDQFMNESLISLVKLRLRNNASWEYANEILLQNGGLGLESSISINSTTTKAEGQPSDADVHMGNMTDYILDSDHLAELAGNRSSGSFPLVAMQFAMRYFARCTKYCLNCHRKVGEGFEALRPYVCSNPLCLFQYMTIGLGPNVEHEILTEPSVVDLLVSLCYASLQSSQSRYQTSLPRNTNPNLIPTSFPIREFPVGLRLRVPNIFTLQSDRPAPILVKLLKYPIVGFGVGTDVKRLLPNSWIVLRYRHPNIASGVNPEYTSSRNARIKEVSPEQNWVEVQLLGPDEGETDPGGFPMDASEADLVPYDVDFDNLSDYEKSIAMQTVLATLPPILKIRDYLLAHQGVSLKSFDLVSPAAATLLVWIVSSNRSCINEICTLERVVVPGSKENGPESDSGLAVHDWTVKEKRKKEYIPGMNGYIQFRFSQGSADKELRFNKALQELAKQKDLTRYPTIFAWHGSDVANWHSILRSGLDFKEIKYGRAFGNGVYFSPHLSTSIGYATSPFVARWANSALDVQTVLSLNEIINVPEMFVSQSPHYVVQEPDWHQCRYLFISSRQVGMTTRLQGAAVNVPMLDQDPQREVRDAASKPLRIPAASMPSRYMHTGKSGSSLRARNVIRILDDSEESSAEDQELLVEDRRGTQSRSSSVDTIFARDVPGNAPPTPVPEEPVTDFTPGALDLSTLPRLAPPSWATPTATRVIGRELHKLQAVQQATPLRELGWYIDFGAVTNMFQWIVELHSFDLSIPLAQDMKAANVPSVVMEFRFGKDWPMSPPFVRAIRPRFKLFMHGGGGHVTSGGAMCMELLTNSGWSPANSMESVILQVRMALCSEERGARLDLTPKGTMVTTADYGISEAVEAYMRAAMMHGWEVPSDLRVTASGGAS